MSIMDASILISTVGWLWCVSQAAKMAARLQAANAQNTALLEKLNSVSYVGSDLRTSLASPPAVQP